VGGVLMAGKGSIIDRNGKFYLKIYKGKIDGKDKNKWVRLNATTEKEAEDERAYININRPNLWSDPSRITFSYYAKQFLEDMDRAVKCGRKAVATYEWYEQRIRNHINPKIGRLKFIEIKARDLQSLYDGIYSTSPNMADAVYRILHVMWAEAFRDEDLGVKCNLANKIHKGEKEKYQAPTWTGEQITYFLQNAKSRRYYEVFLLGFAAGMRLGEILGLTWDNIDHKEMIIHVKRSVTLNKKYDLEDLFKRTKNNSSIREIRMILVVSDALKELKKRQTAEELAVSIYHKSGLVFTTEKGQPKIIGLG
jgi:integrase